jgi:transcription elongation factor/antiterminator RfaH
LSWGDAVIGSDESEVGGKRWFALYTKPHKEYMVQGLLHNQQIETYLPEIAVAVRRRDRRDKKPFFPHYLFACLDPHSDQMAKVHWTPGLRRVVSAGGQPVPIPDEIVAHIRHRLEVMVEEKPESPFKRGEIVRVTRGPFEGLDSMFDRALSPQGRVRVLLELMGRLVAADLDVEDLL